MSGTCGYGGGVAAALSAWVGARYRGVAEITGGDYRMGKFGDRPNGEGRRSAIAGAEIVGRPRDAGIRAS